MEVANPGEGSRGPNPSPPPLLLDQTEARRAEINFFGDQAPPYLRVWMTAPLPPPPPPNLSEGLDLPMNG